MCWSKRSSSDFSTVTTTAFTPTGSSTVNDTPVYCHYPAVECSQDATDQHCSFKGKCCALQDTESYCVCSDDYTGKYCESQKFDPFLQESLQANPVTIGIAVGVAFFIVLVTVALVLIVVMTRRKNQKSKAEQSDIPLTEHNSNGKNGASFEDSVMLSDSNHNNTKPTPG